MNKYIVKLCCLFIPKKKNRKHFRDKCRDFGVFAVLFLKKTIKNFEKYDIKMKSFDTIINKSDNGLDNYLTSKFLFDEHNDVLISQFEQAKFTNKLNEINELIYLVLLYEKKQEEMAIIGLKSFYGKFGKERISDFAPLSYLAEKNGIIDDNILKASKIFQIIEKNNKNRKDEFKEYLKNKSIAIIGNNRDLIGKKMGKTFDDKDIVVRMNLFSIDGDYKDDFGTKTNIWFKNQIVPEKYHDLSKFDWIIEQHCHWSEFMSMYGARQKKLIIDSIFTNLTDKTITFNEYRIQCRKNSLIKCISVGLETLYIFYKITGKIEEEQIFGFNNKYRTEKDIYEHVRNQGVIRGYVWGNNEESNIFFKNNCLSLHDFNLELDFRKRMLRGENV